MFDQRHLMVSSFIAIVTCASVAEAQKIYWPHNAVNDHKTQRANLDGTQVECFFEGSSGQGDLAVDRLNRLIYWMNGGPPKGILRANLDFTDIQLVVEFESTPDSPTRFGGLAVDVVNGYLFWGIGEATGPPTGSAGIWRARLDGSEVELLVSDDLVLPISVVVDSRRSKLYWADQDLDVIRRSNLDGSNVEDVVTGLTRPAGLVLDELASKLYWGGRAPSRQPGRVGSRIVRERHKRIRNGARRRLRPLVHRPP